MQPAATALAAVDTPSFAAAAHVAAVEQVPEAERAASQVVTTINEVTKLIADKGVLDMNAAAHRVLLVMTVKEAVCLGIDGSCYVRLVQRRARSLQSSSSGGDTELAVERTYSYATSPNASMPVADLASPALAQVGASAKSAETTALSATTTVTVDGAPEKSLVDDAFVNANIYKNELSLRLPNVGVTTTAAAIVGPPSPPPPPPPPPPSLPRAAVLTDGTNAEKNTTSSAEDAVNGLLQMVQPYALGVVTGLVALACFFCGFVLTRRRRKRMKETRVAPYGAAGQASALEEAAVTWRAPVSGKSAVESDAASAAKPPAELAAVPPAKPAPVLEDISSTDPTVMPTRTPSGRMVLASSAEAASRLSQVESGSSSTLTAPSLSASGIASASLAANRLSKASAMAAPGRKAPTLPTSASSPAIPSGGAATHKAAYNESEFKKLVAAKASSKEAMRLNRGSSWKRVQEAAANWGHAKTMFDDGRYMRSIVAEARAQGLRIAAGRGADGEAPPLLRKYAGRAVDKPPVTTELPDGWDGGGGVRIFPPNLDGAVPDGVAGAFVPGSQRSLVRSSSDASKLA